MSGELRPDYEVLEVDGRQVVAIDLPGIDPQGVRLEVRGAELVVSGRRAPAVGRRTAGGRPAGNFTLRFRLPGPITREELCVDYSAGVLEIELRPLRRIDVEHPSTRVGVTVRAHPIK